MIGLMWHDDNPKTDLASKVEAAAAYYLDKYGCQATVCFVHPTMATEEMAVGQIQVKTSRSVLPGHLWLGVEEKEA